MEALHIAEFPTGHTCFERRPSCALFPIEAYRLPFALKQAWVVRQRPLDPICIGMDVCIMPRKPSMVSVVATVESLSIAGAGWAVFQMRARGMSTGPYPLCVPVVWATLPGNTPVPSQLSMKEWFRFVRLSGVSPGMLNVTLRNVYVPPEGPSGNYGSHLERGSTETIIARSTCPVPDIIISPGMQYCMYEHGNRLMSMA